MKTQKKTFFAGITTILVALCLVLAAPDAGFAQDKFTDADAATLKVKNDPDAVAEILYKLVEIHDSVGKDALKPAVPALIECLNNELAIPEDERWNLVDIVKVLSLSGDDRAKPSLLHIMSTMWGGGNPFVAQGMLSIGNSTIKDVSDSLKSKSADTRGRAALTLYNMKKYDESGSFFSKADGDLIKKGLVANLADKVVNVRINTIVALKLFGDKTIIPALENIEKTDAHKDSGGTYEVRIEASEALKVLRGE